MIISPDILFTELKRHYVGYSEKRHERENLAAEHIELPSILDSESVLPNEDIDIATIMQLEVPAQEENKVPSTRKQKQGRKRRTEAYANGNDVTKTEGDPTTKKRQKRKRKSPPTEFLPAIKVEM